MAGGISRALVQGIAVGGARELPKSIATAGSRVHHSLLDSAAMAHGNFRVQLNLFEPFRVTKRLGDMHVGTRAWRHPKLKWMIQKDDAAAPGQAHAGGHLHNGRISAYKLFDSHGTRIASLDRDGFVIWK